MWHGTGYQRKLKYLKLSIMVNGPVLIMREWRSFEIALPVVHLVVDSRDAGYPQSTHIDDPAKSKEKYVVAEPAAKIT